MIPPSFSLSLSTPPALLWKKIQNSKFKFKNLIQNSKLNLTHHSLPSNANTKKRPPISHGTDHLSGLSHIRHTCPTTIHRPIHHSLINAHGTRN